MSQESKIDYRIKKLSKLSGLNLKDAWLPSGSKARTHCLDTVGDLSNFITRRYKGKEFLYVLDGMINLLERMKKNNEDNKDYALVTTSWEEIKASFESKELDNLKITLTEKDFREIASELMYDYSPEYDFNTALEEQIDKFLEHKGLCKECGSDNIKEVKDEPFPVCQECNHSYFGNIENLRTNKN